jgi:acetyltransferase-like isoleucine patch superfamily enzyme
MYVMNNFYTPDELNALGFKKFGFNLKISKKASLYNCDLMEFGDNVRIDDFCVLSGKLVFGNNIHITAFCLLAGGDEGIFFDSFTTLAYRSCVFTRSDDYSGETLANSTIPEKFRNRTIKKSVNFEKHAIVGAGSIVLPGAHIREGVSVGASSLVIKPTEPWGVYVGVPAARIKNRKKELLEQEKLYLSEQGGQ